MSINEDVLEMFNLYIEDKDIMYYDYICSWSWHDELLIYKDGNKLYVVDDYDAEPYEISQDDALEEMLEFDKLVNGMID